MSAPAAASAPRILVLFGNVPLHGQERANIEAMDALRQTGCEVLFLIREGWTRDTIQAELGWRGIGHTAVPYFDRVQHGQPLRVWWRNLAGIIAGSWQLLGHIRRFRATHLHAGSAASILNFLPALLLTRLPLVFRAGDLPTRHHVLWRLVWRYTVHRAAHLVCDSRFLQAALAGAGVPASKSSVIYTPPPRRRPRERTPEPGAKRGGLVYVYVGQVIPEKGVQELVEAARIVCASRDDARFVVAGDAGQGNPYGQAMVDKARSSGFGERIEFPGFVEDIDALYGQADVHVCPSIADEAYGITVIEAKAHGLPSIVFASGALQEIVTDGVDGIVCKAKTAGALAEAMISYANDGHMRRSHGEAARASLARLGVDEFARRWRDVYDHCH